MDLPSQLILCGCLIPSQTTCAICHKTDVKNAFNIYFLYAGPHIHMGLFFLAQKGSGAQRVMDFSNAGKQAEKIIINLTSSLSVLRERGMLSYNGKV